MRGRHREVSNSSSNYSPGTVQNVDTTRATYFAGDAAMIVWSPFILDEMAGLRNDALPTCDECADDPLFLANNTGLVAALSGGEGTEPAQYGSPSYFGIGAGADVEAAQQFVEYLLGDGYLDYLGVAPEGRFPMRTGTPEAPDSFIEGWTELSIGVDERVPFADIYGPEVVETLVNGAADFRRWGFEDGYGALVVVAVHEPRRPPDIEPGAQRGHVARGRGSTDASRC